MALFRFGGSPFDMLDDNPFSMIQQMSSMMDPFSSMSMFGGFPSPFRMNNFMPPDFGHGMRNSFSSSTVMTMTSGPNGQPQIYQESRSTRTGPGGIKETKKSVCDSRTGTKRMAIGHHIGERGHVRERVQHLTSGEQEEHEDFINLEEEEAEEFNNEWKQKARTAGYEVEPRRQRALPAITSGRCRSRRTASPRRNHPAITYSSPEITEVDDDGEPIVVVEKSRKRPREEAETSHEAKKISSSKKKDGR